MLNNRQHLSSVCFIVLTLGLALQSEIKPGFAASLSGYSVVADGLNNVRGLSFAPDGSLYITEAGVGGDLGCVSGHISNLPVCGGTSG